MSATKGMPLSGVRVVDFTHHAAGPMCTMLLGDYGAEIIKIEPPEGEAFRTSGTVRVAGEHVGFLALNRAKKSVVLDLKTPEGIAAARNIASHSDVVVENWRPGVADRLGLGYEALRELRPAIVYCSISGFGQKGPQSRRPAYAPIVHAASGYDLAQVEYQGGGKPPNTATYTADVFGGMSAFAAIQSALFRRERTGEGQYIDVSLLDGMLNILVAEAQEWQAPQNREARVYPPLTCTDGFLVVAPTSQKNFEGVCEVIGKPEWLCDPRFDGTIARERNWAVLMTLIEEWTRTHAAAECEARLMAAGVPCTRYLTVQEAMQSDQMRARGGAVPVRDPVGEYLVPSAPFQMPGLDAQPRPHVPQLGEHTQAVLSRLGAKAA